MPQMWFEDEKAGLLIDSYYMISLFKESRRNRGLTHVIMGNWHSITNEAAVQEFKQSTLLHSNVTRYNF